MRSGDNSNDYDDSVPLDTSSARLARGRAPKITVVTKSTRFQRSFCTQHLFLKYIALTARYTTLSHSGITGSSGANMFNQRINSSWTLATVGQFLCIRELALKRPVSDRLHSDWIASSF